MEDKILKLEEAVMSKCCSRETDIYISQGFIVDILKNRIYQLENKFI